MSQEVFFEANGLRFRALATGPQEGQLALLVHGFPQTAYCWRNQMNALAQLGYRVLAIDQRGYGGTDKPKGVASYGLSHLADDLAAIIRLHTDRKAVLVGHDWGGLPVWLVARRHPELIERFVTLAAPPPKVWFDAIQTDKEQRKRSWYVFLFQLPRVPERYLGGQNFAKMRLTLEKTSKPGTFSQDDVDTYARAWAQPGALTGMLGSYRALCRTRVFAGSDWRRLQTEANPPRPVPGMLVWGKRDKFLGEGLVEATARSYPGLRVEVLPEHSHWLPEEAPDKVNALLGDFLGPAH